MSTTSRATVNVLASVGAYAVSLAIGILYTPFLVDRLGIAAFGLVPLAFNLVQYFGFLLQTLSSTVAQRLVATLDDVAAYNRAFSTAMLLSLALAAAFALLALATAVPILSLVNIPAGFHGAAEFLFGAVALSFVVSLLLTPISSALFAGDLIYVLSFARALEAVARVMVVVVLFLVVAPALGMVAVGIVAGSLAGAAFLVVAALAHRPSLRLSLRAADGTVLRGMMATGSSVVVMQLGTLLLFNTDLLVVNLSYGAALAGAYAAAAQWGVVLRGLGFSVASAITARVMQAYHRMAGAELAVFVARSIRLMSAFAALPSGYLAGIAPPLLAIWLGDGFAAHAPILVVLALFMPVNLVCTPLIAMALAADRVRPMALSHVVAGVAFVAGAVLATRLLPLGGVEVAAWFALSFGAMTYGAIIPLAGRLVGPGATAAFLRAGLVPSALVLTQALVVHAIVLVVAPQGYPALLLVGILSLPPYAAIVAVVLPRADLAVVRHEAAALARTVRARLRPRRRGPG